MVSEIVKIELHVAYFFALHMSDDVVRYLEVNFPAFVVRKFMINAVRHLDA